MNIPDDVSIVAAHSGRFSKSPLRFWDDGFGPVWVYRESLGVVGIVRAQTFEDAWGCVEDEILNDADPNDPDTYAKSYDDEADEGELAEGCYWRGSGEPSNPGLHSHIGQTDLNGSALNLLTPELAAEYGIAWLTDPPADPRLGGHE